MEKLIVDRIEGELAVCEKENRETVDISLSVLPCGIKEGSIISFDGNGGYVLLSEDEKERRKSLLKMTEDIFSE